MFCGDLKNNPVSTSLLNTTDTISLFIFLGNGFCCKDFKGIYFEYEVNRFPALFFLDFSFLLFFVLASKDSNTYFTTKPYRCFEKWSRNVFILLINLVTRDGLLWMVRWPTMDGSEVYKFYNLDMIPQISQKVNNFSSYGEKF